MPDALHSYCPWGYHPVHLNDTFCENRYEVVQKLGTGSYSIVWLARDHHANRYVALKILRSEFSGTNNESRILRQLDEYRTNNPGIQGAKSIPTLLDEFDFDGPNGRHKCLVTEFAGYSIATSKFVSEQKWRFPVQAARAITAKAVLGVHFLHKAGVVHGDLHNANFMLQIPNIDKLSVDELYRKFSAPHKEPVQRLDGKPLGSSAPAYTVLPIHAWVRAENVTESDIIITDFGEAYVANSEPREDLNTPLALQPPEALLKIGTIGMPADIWTLALTLVDSMGNGTLLEVFRGDRDDIMAEIVSSLGKPPEKWWKAWDKRHEFFNEDGTWLDEEVMDANGRCQDAVWRSLKHRVSRNTIRDGVPLADDEIDALVAMLGGMLKYDPEERSTIEDVMSSEWMKKYGFPAIEADAEEKRLEQASPSKEPQDSSKPLLSPCADLTISSEDASGATKVEPLIDPSSNDSQTETSQDTPTEILHDISPARVSELEPIAMDTTATPSTTTQKTLQDSADTTSKPTSDSSKGYQPAETTSKNITAALTDGVNHEDIGNDIPPHDETPSDAKPSSDDNLPHDETPSDPKHPKDQTRNREDEDPVTKPTDLTTK
ncbi:MAG: hypothetical protein Q9183_004142 [Haloplaca sp. 2 TL-2023]